MARLQALMAGLANALVFLACGVVPAQAPPNGLQTPASDDPFRPFFLRYCQECHGIAQPKGKFHLDELSDDFSDESTRNRWLAVRKRLMAGTMPPKSKARPPEKEVRELTDWVETRLTTFDSSRRDQGRVVLRRLNRVEYNNTVSDLLHVDLDLREMLALDGSLDGFDNVGTGLHLSSFALERYVEAADIALNTAIVNRSRPATLNERYSLKNQHVVRGEQTRNYFRVMDDDTVVCFSSVWPTVSLSQFCPREPGRYRFRICASGFQSSGKPVTFEVSSDTTGLVGYFDVPADEPKVIEFVTRIEIRTSSGPTGFSFLPYGLGKAEDAEKSGPENYQGPGLAVHWVEAEGPLYDDWPPESHRQIFGELSQSQVEPNSDLLEVISEHPEADAERILRGLVRRAFRRKVAEHDLQLFLALVQARLAEHDSFEQAVRVGLTAVMTSPRFLFLDEKPGQLDDFALASRLSYFLWSSMPDEELLDLAEHGRLSDAETLREQVDRLLGSPKSAAFATNFCGQWLGLRNIDVTAPHYLLYPEFDQMLKVSMVRETELFFTEVLQNDLSLMNFVDSDFSMLNGRLAQHYGIPGIEGLWEFRKAPLPPGSHRGGVLTMASVLKVTANGTTTSPVTRGAWVLERILGTPPPRPPANVPPLEPDVRGATTIREQLAKHRNQPSCAACHAKIDPPGFALENFDVIGGWREYYRLANWVRGAKEVAGKHYLQGPDVDSAGETADGEAFQNIDQFKQLLLRDKDQIARGMTQRLVTYATGGSPELADIPEVEAIIDRIRQKNYGLRTLVHEVVQSQMFHNK